MALSLDEAIARVPLWQGQELRITPLGGGITNQNYRIDDGDESYVLRIAGAKTELLGIDRETEYAATRLAGEHQIAPEVVYFIRPEGYLVTRFIKGRPIPPEEMRQPETTRKVAQLLRRVHELPDIPGTFSVFRVTDSYAQIARQHQVAFPADFEWLLGRMQDAEKAMQAGSAAAQPCHNDLLNENFLDDGQIRLLDWEYAGKGDIFFDLANFSVHHNFNDENDRLLLETYFGEVTPDRWARLKVMRIASDFREAMWGLVQCGISKLDFDFRAYADKHFNRMASNMNNPLWGQWLKEIS